MNVNKTTVYFLGPSRDVAEVLNRHFNDLNKSSTGLNVAFKGVHPRDWEAESSKPDQALLFYETTGPDVTRESRVVREIMEAYPQWQWVLMVESNIDYFEIATRYRIGNIVKKDRFDLSMIRALTLRLTTGSIFGFAPYFPKGYTMGPLDKVIRGEWEINNIMKLLEEYWQPRFPEMPSPHAIRTYFYELLTNTLSYSVVGINPKERDINSLSIPSSVYIPPEKPFKISMAVDKEKCGFSFMDNSGTLTLERVLEKFRRQSKIGNEDFPPGIMDVTGRGLSLIQKDNRLIINIMKNHHTEIIFLHYNERELNRYESIIITELTSGG